MLLSLTSLFYFMVFLEFICETTHNKLEVNQFDDYVEISIDNNSSGLNIPAVHLTIKDAEKLMDEIHKMIIQIEGGK